MSNRTDTNEDPTRPETSSGTASHDANGALAADGPALPTRLTRPTPIPPPDDLQLPTLNRFWAARPAGAFGWRGFRTRLARFARPLIQLLPWRQSAFNAALVDHLNRASAREHAAKDATTQSLDGLHDDLGALLAYLHTNIPAYALALQLPRSLAESLSALSDDMRKRWESVSARQQRLEAAQKKDEQVAAELRVSLGLLQRSVAVVERECERVLTGGGARAWATVRGPDSVAARSDDAGPGRDAEQAAAVSETAWEQLAGSAVTASKYVGFEDSFRGSTEEVRERLSTYLPLFSGASDVLDFGCGRGEFLDLLGERGISAQGVDINHEMVEVCRARDLHVTEGDGLAYLEGLPDGALGGLFASQVVEHLQPDQLLRLVGVAFHKLRPGATVALETINPACWFAFFESYLRDLTHVRAVHPDTLKYLLQASGFQQIEVRFLAPVAERDKLQAYRIAAEELASDPVADLADTFNANVEKINRLMFTHLDYAAIAVRP
jgi:SAM-dependent methyltransferase